MAAETFETYYVKDWGIAKAREARNRRREDLVRLTGSSGVVRGKVHHPAHGTGYEVWFRIPGEGALYVRDLRVGPDGITEPQTAPKRLETEEKAES